MKASKILQVVTTHTGGEPTCIVYGGLKPIPGKTMQQRMQHMQQHEDKLRTAICLEPRGGVRCGVILTDPCDPRADIGVLHFSTSAWMPMCGHNTIGLAVALVETGMVDVREPVTEIVMDTPAGLVTAKVNVKDGEAQSVTFRNAPSFVLALDCEVETERYGRIKCDISYGGNIGAVICADSLGLQLKAENAKQLVQEGLYLYNIIKEQVEINHPTIPGLGLHHVQFSAESDTEGVSERNTVVNMVGNIDRSPCGTGTCAKLAVKHAKGLLAKGEKFVHESLLKSTFDCVIVDECIVNGIPAVISEITGTAYITGIGSLIINDKDPQTYGFKL